MEEEEKKKCEVCGIFDAQPLEVGKTISICEHCEKVFEARLALEED